MAISQEHSNPQQSAQRPSSEQLSPGDILQRLAAFDGPPEAFLANLLSVQCALVGAAGGALLRPGESGHIEPAAVFPPLQKGQTPPSWLAQAVEMAGAVLQSGKTTVRPLHSGGELYGENAARHLVIVPLRTERGPIGVGGFYLESAGNRLDRVAERLELTSGLLSTYTLRQRLQQREVDLQLLKQGVESLVVVNQNNRFKAAAMALCNQLSSEWDAHRVSVGFLQGRHVKLKAMSHTEKFTRNMQLVQAIEAAMEECLDQDLEILYPNDEESTYVYRAAKKLGTQYGPSSVVSLPLRENGEVVAVLTLERDPEKPFQLQDIETLRLTADLCTPRVTELQQRDRWLGARLAGGLRKGAGVVIGPKHTWVKLIVLALAGLLAFGIFAKGTHTVEAPFTIEPALQSQVPAPQAGTLDEVLVEVGDEVTEGQVLARLDTALLREELLNAQAELSEYRKEIDIARAAWIRDRKETSYAYVQRATAKQEQVEARIRLLKMQIERSELKAPIAGTVIKGDLRKRVNGPVEKSEVLFEIAPIQSMRAELRVDEADIADLEPGDTGKLATTGAPGEFINFTVVRIDPVAQTEEENNIFRVRAELDTIPPQWKPGMEGMAKVQLEPRSYVWLLTHDLVDWIRMKLWW